MQPEPIYDLAHLGHMELLTSKPEESLKFSVDVMGHEDDRDFPHPRHAAGR